MEHEQTNDEAFRDKNGKYLNRNDRVMCEDGEVVTFREIVPPFMYADCVGDNGAEHQLNPKRLEKLNYVI